MEVGDYIKLKTETQDFFSPMVIWNIFRKEHENLFIVSSQEGLTVNEVRNALETSMIVLPDLLTFKILTQSMLESLYTMDERENKIKNAIEGNLGYNQIEFCSRLQNCIATGINLEAIFGFLNSSNCDKLVDSIREDRYSTIKSGNQDPTIITSGKSFHELSSNVNLLPLRFAFLKLIVLLRNGLTSQFPSPDQEFQNSLIAEITYNFYVSYLAGEKQNIRNYTVNYRNRREAEAPSTMPFNFMMADSKWRIEKHREFLQGEEFLNVLADQLPITDEIVKKGIMTSLAETDITAWQRCILNDILDDIPTSKCYNEKPSETYRYLLLFPFFNWLDPILFIDLRNRKNVIGESPIKLMVARMKNAVEGKVSL